MQDRAEQFHRQVGRLLLRWREAKGLSQEALAVQLQRDQSYISRIEAGERLASVAFLLEWADALDVQFEDLAAELVTVWRDVSGS